MPAGKLPSEVAAVQRFYDTDAEGEWARLDEHRTEFAVSLRALGEYLPPAPARVLDCGGGPGRYAIELASRGYRVTIFDLSKGNLQMARAKADAAGVQLDAYEHGTATDLGRFPEASFDAVLLMGPLYHLLEREDRVRALSETCRVLAPGGPLFAAFVTRYAGHRYAAANDPLGPLREAETYARILRDGCQPPQGEGGVLVGYFAHPSEVTPLCEEAGLSVEKILAAEGLLAAIEDRGVNALEGAAWDYWVDLNYRVAGDPSLHGGADHLLVIARRIV